MKFLNKLKILNLCSNLFLDFENLNMKNKNANLIDDLGRQTLKQWY